MTTLKAFLKRHPLLAYLALMFAISWGGILVVVGPGLTPLADEQFGTFIPLFYLAMLAGPSVAGILLTALFYGKAGLRALASRLLRWRVGARWYAAALLIAPLLVTATLLTLSLASPDFLPRLYTTSDRAFVLQFSLLSALIVGFFEELGWTGFAVPALRRRYGVFATGLITGLLVAVWHAPLIYVTRGTSPGTMPLALWLPAVLLTWLPAFRVLMVWVYERTASLLLAILMHTSLIASWTMFTPPALAGAPLVTYYLVFTAAMWTLIAAFAVTHRRQGARQEPLRRVA